MKRIRRFRMRPAMPVAVIALIVGLGGSAVAAQKLGLGALSNGAKNKTVGVGKLTYVNTTKSLPGGSGKGVSFEVNVSATCPPGLKVIGGGIKAPEPTGGGGGNLTIDQSYPTTSGWAGTVSNFSGAGLNTTATTTAICASSRVVTGAPPAS